MRGTKKSRLACGGTLAAGATFLLGGCAVIGDTGDDGQKLDQYAAASVIMCHINPTNGTFADVMVDGDSVADRLAQGDTIGTCAAALCGGS